jgi:hypothetical protein
VDYRVLACHPNKLTPYVQDHMSSALQALEELYIKMPPVIASDDDQRELWIELRDTFVSDMRGALDHLAAALNAIGCTGEELGGELEVWEGSNGAPVTRSPSWVTVTVKGGSLSPSDVVCVSGDVTKK